MARVLKTLLLWYFLLGRQEVLWQQFVFAAVQLSQAGGAERWKEMLAGCRMPSEDEFPAWTEMQPSSEEEYPMYIPED